MLRQVSFQLFNTHFLRDRWFLFFTILSGSVLIIHTSILLINLSFLQSLGQEIALHTKQYSGVDFYSSWYFIFVAPIMGLLVFVGNYLCAKKIKILDKTLFYSLSLVSFLVQFGILFALLHVIKINAF